MDILIKGMGMPRDIEPGLVIEFADGIDGKRYARLWHYRHGGLTEWFEAISIPPHGRLIDADAIRANIDEKRPGRSYEDAWALTVLDNAPTIIPASKEVCNGNI